MFCQTPKSGNSDVFDRLAKQTKKTPVAAVVEEEKKKESPKSSDSPKSGAIFDRLYKEAEKVCFVCVCRTFVCSV